MTSLFSLDNILDVQNFAFETGYSFRGLTISEAPEGYRAILRGFSRSGEARYCLSVNETAHGALEGLWEAVTMAGGDRLWHRDKFYYKGG